MKRRIFKIIFLAIFIGYTTPVFACSVCAMASFDYTFPPIFLWQLFPVVWFLTACFVSKPGDPYTGLIPSFWKGALIGVGSIILSLIFGPLAFLLLIPCLILSFFTLFKGIRLKWDESQRKKYIAVSKIGCIFFVLLVCYSTWIRSHRTTGEFVVQWSGTAPARLFINQLKDNPASDLDDIRLIVSEANEFAAAGLAETLAERGDPKIDFPILIKRLKEERESSNLCGDDFESALVILTGLNLPPGSSVQDWETAFSNQKKDSFENDKEKQKENLE